MDHPRIVRDPNIMAGKPTIKGTRVKVETILMWLGKGESVETLIAQFRITRDDVLACQAYAADVIANQQPADAAE